jgi:hypothetical protein
MRIAEGRIVFVPNLLYFHPNETPDLIGLGLLMP